MSSDNSNFPPAAPAVSVIWQFNHRFFVFEDPLRHCPGNSTFDDGPYWSACKQEWSWGKGTTNLLSRFQPNDQRDHILRILSVPFPMLVMPPQKLLHVAKVMFELCLCYAWYLLKTHFVYNVAASSLTQSHQLTKCATHRQDVNNMLSGRAFKRSNRAYHAGMK